MARCRILTNSGANSRSASALEDPLSRSGALLEFADETVVPGMATDSRAAFLQALGSKCRGSTDAGRGIDAAVADAGGKAAGLARTNRGRRA